MKIEFNEKEKYIEFNGIKVYEYVPLSERWIFLRFFKFDFNYDDEGVYLSFKDAHKLYKQKAFVFFESIDPDLSVVKYYLGIQTIKAFPQSLKNMKRLSRLIPQAEKDGLKNIVPFILFYGWSPQVLKRKIGAPTWKKIANNTMQHNRAVVRFLAKTNRYGEKLNNIKYIDDLMGFSFKEMITPKWFSCKHSVYCVYARRTVKEGDRFDKWIVRDTILNANRLALPYSKKWSWRKWKEKHDEYSDKWQIRVFEEIDVDYEEVFSKQKSIIKKIEAAEFKEYNIKVISSLKDFISVSKKMEHCISSYAMDSFDGYYVAIQIKNQTTKKESTIGMNWGKKLTLEQHKGFRNRPPSKEDVAFGKNLVSFLNS